jgi:hypothetical protein
MLSGTREHLQNCELRSTQSKRTKGVLVELDERAGGPAKAATTAWEKS